jgi:hypothetical protein
MIPTVKIVLIYDTLIRPDTTGTHCLAALRQLAQDVSHYQPLAGDRDHPTFRHWQDLPPADLYLQIDDDLAYPFPPVRAKKAYWCIDVHRMDTLTGGPATRRDKIKLFDRVFSAQRDMALELNVPWLPLAYDPDLIHPLTAREKIYDWCFIGNPVTPQRSAALDLLKSHLPNAFVGQAYGHEMNRIYNLSRLAVNVTLANDVNMRFFEAQGSGTPLLSNRPHNGEDHLFDAVLYYDSPNDLPHRAAELLADPTALASASHHQLLRVRAHHTYQTRMQQLLTLCQ